MQIMQDIRTAIDARKHGDIAAYWEGAKLPPLTEEPPEWTNVPYVEGDAISRYSKKKVPKWKEYSKKYWLSLSGPFNSNVISKLGLCAHSATSRSVRMIESTPIFPNASKRTAA